MVSPPDTMLVDGNDLRTDFPGFRIVGDMHLFSTGVRRGEDDVIPGRHGQYGVPNLPIDAYAFSVSVWVNGATRGAKINNLFEAGVILMGAAGDGLVTLTRKLANVADDGQDDYQARGRYVSGLDLATLNPFTGQCELQFVNLSGSWTRLSDSAVMPA